jgi:hypothetical protein
MENGIFVAKFGKDGWMLYRWFCGERASWGGRAGAGALERARWSGRAGAIPRGGARGVGVSV